MKKTGLNKSRQQKIAEEQDRDLPGYPHYPEKDDIMNPGNGLKKVNADGELANSGRLSTAALKERDATPRSEFSASQEEDDPENEGAELADERDPEDEEELDEGEDVDTAEEMDAEVTEEDLENLGDIEGDQDMGEDEFVGNARVDNPDETLDEEDDLDIPGAELDNRDEAIGEEDEENNYYSLGGERHEDLEDDQ